MSIPSLKHLAQEHLAAMGLVVAAREAKPENEADLPKLAQKICEAFASQMEPHFQDEERSVLPRVRAMGREDLVNRTLDEHKQMRELIAHLAQKPSVELLQKFSTMLREHIHFENNEVWEALEEDAIKDTSAL